PHAPGAQPGRRVRRLRPGRRSGGGGALLRRPPPSTRTGTVRVHRVAAGRADGGAVARRRRRPHRVRALAVVRRGRSHDLPGPSVRDAPVRRRRRRGPRVPRWPVPPARAGAVGGGGVMTAVTGPAPSLPGPSRASAVSMLITMGRDRLGMMTSAAARYGDAALLPVGPKELYFFNHPEHAKHVLADNAANYHKGIGLVHARRALGDGLLTSEGELWRKQRRVAQPAFQSRRIAQQAGIVAEEAAALVGRLRTLGRQGPVDVLQEMTGLTLGVLGRTLLDTDLGRFPSIGRDF